MEKQEIIAMKFPVLRAISKTPIPGGGGHLAMVVSGTDDAACAEKVGRMRLRLAIPYGQARS